MRGVLERSKNCPEGWYWPFVTHLSPCVFMQLTGPWRSLWVRFGYDPRKHPEAKIYQVLDFRIRCGMKYGKRAQPTETLSLLSG